MATIPIEVIVQDAENPVGPTPVGPTDSGDNTNITVPDTGAGTVDSNNSGINNSSAAISIVSIIIAVLAIGAVITLLVRKYHKRKTSEVGMTRQERRAVAATSTIAVLALTVLLGQLVVAGVVSPIATNAATDDTVSDEAELDVDSKITIIATRAEDEDTTVATVKNTSTATSHQTFGYKVTASMADNATTANLYLDGDETSEYYIAPVTDDVLTNNTWGYTTEEESKDYLPIPLATDPTTIVKGYDNIDDEPVDIYYTIQVDKDLPAGTYTGTLEYILADNNFPSTLTTMQGMTTEICEDTFTPDAFKADSVTIEDIVPTATLIDIRDNKTYTVAKLADGNCWMAQNLDLQKEDLVVASLDSANTDNPAEGFELPDSQTSGDEDWMDWGHPEEAINTAHVYDLGNSNVEYERYGNYYNWYTATAGTGTYNIGDSDGTYRAVGSICPTGWRLPNNSNEQEGDNYGVTDYSNLLYQYGILKSATSKGANTDKISNMYIAPLLLVRAGKYDNGTKDIGYDVYIWSSLASNEDTIDARDFEYSIGSIKPWAIQHKYGGYSVRCVAE